MQSAITQKTNIAKIKNIDFSFDSALCASLMKMGAKLRGCLHILTWDKAQVMLREVNDPTTPPPPIFYPWIWDNVKSFSELL